MTAEPDTTLVHKDMIFDPSYHTLRHQVFSALAAPDGAVMGLRCLEAILKNDDRARSLRFYYEEILGRSPESGELAQKRVDAPFDCICDFITSAEFLVWHDIILQREFPHLKREIFFHIPKSGGTTVFHAFDSDRRFCIVHLFPGYDNGWFSAPLSYLQETVSRLINPCARSIFVHGHFSADRILRYAIKRGRDNAFTILRNPIDTCVSGVNYVLTQLCVNPSHPDVVGWRKTLELSDGPLLPEHDDVARLVPKILESIVPSNPVCATLGTNARLESAVENAVILGLRIVPFERIDDYIQSRGITDYERMNESTKFINLSDLDQHIRLTVYEKTAADLQFFDWVHRHGVHKDGLGVELSE